MSGWRTLCTTTARGREPHRMPFAIVDTGGWERWCTPGLGRPYGTPGGGWEPWGIPGEGRSDVLPRGVLENNGASSVSAMVYDLTVADESVLQCRICFLPLKPPIFQVQIGLVLDIRVRRHDIFIDLFVVCLLFYYGSCVLIVTVWYVFAVHRGACVMLVML